ncbi:glycosyltransferase family 4 protein [Gammaproteobacteria bacterium]|nr:glycosyltransferase family 4 protein [Gammaproteobacteria bacterium]
MLIPNGVDTTLFRPDIEAVPLTGLKQEEGRKVVLFVGKMTKYYCLDLIIEAIPLVRQAYPEATFVFIGDGDDQLRLRQLCRQKKILAAVVFTGFKLYSEIPRCIARADVCVFPLPDSSALALFEYMACGKATVIPNFHTDKMGVANDLIPDSCVIKVDNSPTGIAHGINLLLENENLRKRIGSAARRRVERDFDWDALSFDYEAALARVSDEYV